MSSRNQSPVVPQFIEKHHVQRVLRAVPVDESRVASTTTSHMHTPKEGKHRPNRSWCHSSTIKQRLSRWDSRLIEEPQTATPLRSSNKGLRCECKALDLFQQMREMYEELSQEFFKEKARNQQLSHDVEALKQTVARLEERLEHSIAAPGLDSTHLDLSAESDWLTPHMKPSAKLTASSRAQSLLVEMKEILTP